ncbi:cytochrome b5-like isoform X2 [Littorina saxatilis]
MTTLVQTAPVRVHVDSVHNPENIPPVFSRRDVMKHCDETSCWIIVEDKVYDVTRFLDLHPGGSEIIMECAGSEASAAFWDKGHSRHAIRMLDQYYIGQLKPDPKLG